MGDRRATEVSSADDLLGEPDEQLSRRSRRRRDGLGWGSAIFVLLGLAVLAGGLYAVAYLLADAKVPRGTTVEGVAIGGMSPAAAVAELEEQLQPRADQPLTVQAGDRSQHLTGAQAGLEVDLLATVERAGAGSSWAPDRLWDYWTGGGEIEPVVDVDQTTLDAAVAQLVARTATAPVNGAVRFDRQGGIRTREPRTGTAVDTGAAARAISGAYLSTDREVRLPLTTVQPEIGPEDVQTALDDFANAAVSGPVTLQFGSSPVRLTPKEFAPVLSMVPQDGALVPRLDRPALAALVEGRTADAGAPVDATVRLVDGKPRVVPGKPGVTYDDQQVATAFLGVVAKPDGQRTAKVTSTSTPPDFTAKDARALGIKEEVSSFTTYYPYAEYRNINIGRAAELIDGTVLKPGETFSLNDVVGKRTRENGFTEGFVISDGIFKEDLGGGVSQMATTTYNAAFFAGLEDVEHKPHSLYIDRYPEGREATVSWGTVDLRFKNDTPYGVLVHATLQPATGSSQGVVTVSMWSTDYWDISSSTSARYDFTSPGTRTLTGDDCVPNTGYGGFDVDVTRTFRKAGQSAVDHRETRSTTYIPSDTVVCKSPTP